MYAGARAMLAERVAQYVESMDDEQAARLLRCLLRDGSRRPSPVARAISEIAFSDEEMARLIDDAVTRKVLPVVSEALESRLQDDEGRLSYPQAFFR